MINDIRFHAVREDLCDRYGHALSPSAIRNIVDETIADHSASATIDDFLPVLVARDASLRIEQTGAQVRPRIRFVSSSQTMASMAAAVARDLAGEEIVATAGETHPENLADARFESVMQERGLTSPRSQREHSRVLSTPELVIHLSADEEQDVAGRHVLVWDLPSPDGMGMEEIRELADDVSARVMALLVGMGIDFNTQPRLAA